MKNPATASIQSNFQGGFCLLFLIANARRRDNSAPQILYANEFTLIVQHQTGIPLIQVHL